MIEKIMCTRFNFIGTVFIKIIFSLEILLFKQDLAMIEGIKSISSGFEFLKITDITGKGFENKIIFVILVLTEMCM